MDRVTIERKVQLLQEQFSALNKEKAEHDERSSAIEAELFRMQGDFRTYNQLLSELPIGEEQAADNALVVDAEEDTSADGSTDTE